MICAALDFSYEMGASYTQQQPPPDLLASSAAASAPAPSAASVASSAGGSHHHQHQQQQQQQQQQQLRRKASCPKLGENIVMLLCLSRVRRMGGRWYRAVSHMRTGKRKKEKKRPYRPADYDRMREASEAAMDMSEMELAEIVANLLKKVFKEIQDDCREAFVRAWLRDDDARCVLTVPDGKGKMKRIDGLRGSDKVWRLDTLVAMLYHGVPMDSTDTGLLVHRCEDELCVNPRHLSFQCGPAMMSVAMEMLRVAGYDVTPRVAPAAVPDPSGNSRYFQFTSPFPVDVIRREMSESMALPKAVLDRYQLSSDDAAYVQDNYPEIMTAYKRLLAVGTTTASGGLSIAASCASGSATAVVSNQPLPRQQHGSLLASLSSCSTTAASLLFKSEAVSPASCSSASATPSSAASAGGGVKRPPSESPTNAQMPFKKRRPLSSTDFTPVAATPPGGGGGAYREYSGGFDRRSASDDSAAGSQPSQSHYDPHNQSAQTEEELVHINQPAAREADAATALISFGTHNRDPAQSQDLQKELVTTLYNMRSSPICPRYSVFTESRSLAATAAASNVAASSAAASNAGNSSSADCVNVMPAPLPSAKPLPRPRPMVPRRDGTLTELGAGAAAGAAAASSSTSMSNLSTGSTCSASHSTALSATAASAASVFTTSLAPSVPMQSVFRPIPTPEIAPLRRAGGSTTPVGHSPLQTGRNDTPTAIRIILELQGSSGGGGGLSESAASIGSGSLAGGGGGSGGSGRLQALRGGVSVDHFEHMLRANPGATPTWPLTSGDSSPVKLMILPSNQVTTASSGAAAAAAATKSSTDSAGQQRKT